MNKLSSLFAASLVLSGSIAIAQPVNTTLESFAGISGAFDGATTPAGFAGGGTVATPFTAVNTGDFGNGGTGGLSIISDDATDFPMAADTNYLTWDGDDDQFALLQTAAPITGTAGTIYTAFAFRIDSIGLGDIEIFRLGQDVSSARSISISLEAGDLTLNDVVAEPAADGDFAGGNAVIEASTAAGGWRVFAIEANLDAVNPTSTVTVTEVTSGGAVTQLLQVTGFEARFDTGVTDYGYGAFIAAPIGNASDVVSLDEVRIYDNSEIANSNEFITAVGADYFGLVNANVTSWEMFDN